MMKKMYLLATIALAFMTVSCNDKDDDPVVVLPSTATFTVTIENVFEGKEFFNSGTTGLITPGGSESFSFNAGKGHYLQFGTMYVKSNDLFYAPSDMGIALYDMDGNAVTGNVTSQIYLWDAGTEVNEEPGVGANQPMNQSGPNTGMTEGGNVQFVSTTMDGFTYPMTVNVISVMITHDGGTLFTVTINNISGASILPSPFAPGTWVIHNAGQKPMFTSGAAASMGLEKIAEDGDNSAMDTNLSSKSGLVSPFAPGAYSVGLTNDIFMSGGMATAALEALAEDGNPSGFTNVFNTPVGAGGPGALFPMNSYSFTVDAEEGDKLSFATMLVQSNDWFFSADNLELFSNGTVLAGDITDMIKLFDAGTEVDEYAGAGNYQPVRQSGANTGMDENGNAMSEVYLNANVPSIDNMIKVTITAN